MASTSVTFAALAVAGAACLYVAKGQKAQKPKLQIGYWAMRGLQQPVRLALAYVEADYEDVRYTVTGDGDAVPYSRAEWTDVKFTLGLEFPNLPYLIDGDVKLTESNAVLTYVGHKYGLIGSSAAEHATVEMFLCMLYSLRNDIVRVAYSDKASYQTRLDDLMDVKAPKSLDKFELAVKGKQFLIGKQITVADFVLYELVDQLRLMNAAVLEPYPLLREFLGRVEALPTIARYMKSSAFIARPVNNPTACFK